MDGKKKCCSDKTKVVSAAIITILVISTSLLLTATLIRNEQVIQAILSIGIALAILIFMVPFIKRRYFDVKKGYPYEDERSKKIMTNALAKAYLISIYWLLALSWASYNIIEFRDVSQAMGAGILGMAALFGICYLYVNWRGKLE